MPPNVLGPLYETRIRDDLPVTSPTDSGSWLAPLASVVLVSAIPLLVAAVLPRDEARLRAATGDLVSVAVGALLGGAMLHLIPEAFDTMPSVRASILTIGGFFAFLLLELTLLRRGPDAGRRTLPTLSVTGDAAHNLVDGMVIAASFQIDTTTGIATTMAVILHEVPQEVGDFGVLLYGGLDRRRAVLVNLISAGTAIVGVILVLVVGARAAWFARALVPFAAGGFLYIAAADLVPALRESTRRVVRHVLLVLAGIALTALPLALEAS